MNTNGYGRPVISTSEMPVYSFAWLCDSMRDRQVVRIMDNYGNVRRGVIVGITPESGSGKDWLVKIDGETVYVRAV